MEGGIGDEGRIEDAAINMLSRLGEISPEGARHQTRLLLGHRFEDVCNLLFMSGQVFGQFEFVK